MTLFNQNDIFILYDKISGELSHYTLLRKDMPAGSMSFPAFCQESKRSPPRLQTVFFPGFPYPHTEKREKSRRFFSHFK